MHIAVVCFTCKQLALTKPRIEIPRRKSGIWPKSSVNMWKRHPMLELLEAGFLKNAQCEDLQGHQKHSKTYLMIFFTSQYPQPWDVTRLKKLKLAPFKVQVVSLVILKPSRTLTSGNWRFPTNIRYCKQKFRQSCVIHSSITYRFFICPELVSQPCKSVEK